MLALKDVKVLALSTVIDITAKFSDIPDKVRSCSTLTAERANTILQKLDYRRKEIENLRQEGIIC
jgi:crotonobetainyl-CoA:carnitine CoA-transferase CaiB-like acyl-CoA transferase